MRYIALLRAVNVGGHVVKMERLRDLFGELGYGNVRTYIQSGNVFFDTDEEDRAALSGAIEERLSTALGYAVPTCLRTVPELERTLALNPFTETIVTPDMRLNIVFAARPILTPMELPAWSPKRDMEIRSVTAMEAFVVWYLKDGRPVASDAFLKKALGAPLTSRFLHTTVKLLEAART
ncbi:MAG TPA: DUF1697 domain-containing protein [Ktedonobacterales bacterium]|nr:DUF1697 domain-containing protein [Ktedonobacterales bacterium]